jgi:DNA-binding GntR family transcriptional regulator
MDESKQSLRQIRSKSLREHTVDMLREAILIGDLKPGESLIETDLSERLGVSRAPIREALQILNKEGLVDIVPYHRTTVRRLRKVDIEELYSMRILLETFAVRRLIALSNPDHITAMRDSYSEMLKVAHAEDMQRMNIVDRAFHTSLIVMCNHALLVSMWETVAMKVRQIMALRTVHNTDIHEIAHSHLPIIDAIAVGDEATAIPLLEKHIVTAGYLIVEDWDDGAEDMA